MTGPRHISTCVNEWLDGCPFNLPDALQAIRDEQRAAIDAAAAEAKAKVTAAKEAVQVREVAAVDVVLARHSSSDDNQEDVA